MLTYRVRVLVLDEFDRDVEQPVEAFQRFQLRDV